MTSRSARLPLTLSPLIAEAKRRMRRRRLQIAAIVIVLVLAAGGGTLLLAPVGAGHTESAYAGPYLPGGLFTGLGGVPPGDYSDAPTWGGAATVAVSSRSDAWVLGPVAWHWNGQAWRSVPLPQVGAATLWASAADASGDAWAVGALGNEDLLKSSALIEHWDGVRWQVDRLPHLPASFLYGVSAAGPRSAWAVGGTYAPGKHAGDLDLRKTRALLLHWDGASWRNEPLPWARGGVILDKVVATGPSSVWAISTGQQDASSKRPVVIEHWNGSRWQSVPAPFGQADRPSDFTATSWNDAWAVGSYGYGGNKVTKFSRELAAHWNGHAWHVTPLPNPPGSGNSSALLSVAASRPDDVLALGESQHLELQGSNGISSTDLGGYFLQWNGSNWQAMQGSTPVFYDGFPSLAAGRDGSAWVHGLCEENDFLVGLGSGGWETVSRPPGAHPTHGGLPARPACQSG